MKNKKFLIIGGMVIFLMGISVSVAIAQKPYSGVALKVSMIDEIRERQIIKLLPAFEEKTGMKVHIDLYGFEELYHKNLAGCYGHTGEYDVLQLHHPDLPLFSQWLFDISDWIKRDWKEIDVDDIYPLLRETHMRYNGKWYGMPTHVNPMVLFYRKDILAEYGFTVPRTWDELIKMANTITDKLAPKVYGVTFMGRKEIQLACTYLNFLGSYGQYIYKHTSKGLEPTINSPGAVEALEKLVQLKGPALPGVTGYGFDENMMAFARGKAATSIMWSSVVGVYKDPAKSAVVGKWGIARMPGVKLPDGTIRSRALLGGWSVCISKDSKHKKAAWEFLKWLISKKLERELVPYYESCRISLLSNPEIQKDWPNYKAFYEILKAGPIDFPGVPPGEKIMPDYEVLDYMEVALSDTLMGVTSPKAALDDLEDTYYKIFRRWGMYKP
ncbi:sugar ABC transporter substrate-binding protein [Candidatus Aerophobetes bacterium]|nr:sugar ABC transporter substrate-binding protein [Candidatus Aerophobetes bacterium]